jgi:hypothetical protein
MLKLSKRHGSKFWTARGRVKVDQSLRTGDRREADVLLAKIQKEIFDQKSGRESGGAALGPTFAEAVISYVEQGGEKRFLEPLLKHFGELPISKIDQAAINAAAIELYPKCSSSTKNRRVYGPISAVLKSNGVEGKIRRLKNPDGVIRWLTYEKASHLINACFSAYAAPCHVYALHRGASW